MAQFCHRIGIMQSGELVEVGLADEIAHRAQHPYTRRLWSAFPSLPHRKAAGAAS
jgi:ABC-type dipeptide/oligopeptide/nickel transport system ATPase component